VPENLTEKGTRQLVTISQTNLFMELANKIEYMENTGQVNNSTVFSETRLEE
jgi:hypothetical protein